MPSRARVFQSLGLDTLIDRTVAAQKSSLSPLEFALLVASYGEPQRSYGARCEKVFARSSGGLVAPMVLATERGRVLRYIPSGSCRPLYLSLLEFLSSPLEFALLVASYGEL